MADETPDKSEQKPKKRKHRWLRRLVIVAVVLVLLIAAAPYLVSTGPGTHLAAWIASANLNGWVEIDDLSLGWFRSTKVQGLRIYDTSGHCVLNVPNVDIDRSVWGLIVNAQKFNSVIVDRPVIELRQTPTGFSIVEALRSGKGPSKKKKPREGEPARPQGKIAVNNAVIRIVRMDGRSFELTLTAGVEMQGLDRLAAEVALGTPGGVIDATADLKHLSGFNLPGLATAEGNIRVAGPADGGIDVTKLVEATTGRTIPNYAGDVNLEANIGGGRMDATLTVAVDSPAGERAADPNAPEPLRLSLKGKLESDFETFVAKVTLTSTPGTVTAGGQYRRGDRDIAADVTVRLDFEKLLKALAPRKNRSAEQRLAGQLAWRGNVSTVGDVVTFAGKGGIDNLRVGTGKKAVTEKRIDFAQNVRVDRAAETIHLDKFSLDSQLLQLSMAGTVTDYAGETLLDLTGHYTGSWKHITALLHELKPDTAETIAMTGESSGDIRITGPARQPTVRPTFRGVDAGAPVGWASGDVYGLELGKAVIAPALSQGVVAIPATTIPANDGKINLAGRVDLSEKTPAYRLPGDHMLLDGVGINPEMAHQLLGRINSVFKNMVRVSGRVTLRTIDLDIPLDAEAAKKSAVGRGTLDLSELKAKPVGVLADLLAMGGFSGDDMMNITSRRVDFVVKDGRVYYDKFALIFGKDFEVLFSGWVGFDHTMNLKVSVPIRAALLEKYGLRGDALAAAKLLDGLRLEIPLKTTNGKLGLDMKNSNITEIVREAVQRLAKQKAGNLLGDVLKRSGESRGDGSSTPTQLPLPDASDKKSGEEPTTQKSVQQQAVETVFEILRQRQKRRNNDPNK